MTASGPIRYAAALLGALVAGGCAASGALSEAGTVTATTADGVTVYGEVYGDDLGPSAPLVLLFHQAGSNGRGEYAEIAAWLAEAGYRSVAWDQRAGGETHGSTNRTASGLAEGTPAGFCDAYADLQAALDATASMAERVVVWGSSYSAALVVRLAAENPGRVAGVLAASPASGGPMAACRARDWIDAVEVPVLVLRPASEMERETSVEQREILEAAGAEFFVVEHGVHGSSMLVDDRTGHDMRAARAAVTTWLAAVPN